VLEDLEDRLRAALSNAAPEALPTVGVRERIIGAVRARRRRRQQVVTAFAACCLVIAGVSFGVASLHGASHPATNAAAPLAGVGSRIQPAPQKTSSAGLPLFQGDDAVTANCGEIIVSTGADAGCYGVFDRSSDFAINGTEYASAATPPAASSSGNTAQTEPTSPSGNSALGDAAGPTKRSEAKDLSPRQAYRVVVPVGFPVTVVLPGTPGQIWFAPAVAPGQGSGAAMVRSLKAKAGGEGLGSSATFESGIPVTVLVEASALPECGSPPTPCGAPASTWSLVLEFQKS
jgi:hypothetical protein